MTRNLLRRVASCSLNAWPLLLVLLIAPVALSGQGRGVSPKELYKPLGDSWPTYSGDYSGRRYSSLT